MTHSAEPASATAQITEAATRRVTAAGEERLCRLAAISLFDVCACIRGGRGRLGGAWAGDAGGLALAAHARDLDDLHPETLTHPAGVVWPAVIAASRSQDISGARAATAAAIGYELCAATARLLDAEARRFWHPTTVAGLVGAAGAAAWIDAEDAHLTAAVGHALSLAGGSIVCMLELSETRFVHRAHAANAGLLAARSAAAGLRATRLGLESPRGFLTAFASDADPAALLGDGDPAIAGAMYRLHPATGFAQGAIDAARTLAPIAPGPVASLRVDVSPAAAALAGNVAPSTDDDAWWSVPHAVAVALTSDPAVAFAGGLTPQPATLALARLCTLEATRSDLGARVQLELADGRSLAATVAVPTGHPLAPLTDEQRIGKWNSLAGEGGGAAFGRALAIGERPFAETVGALLGA